MLEPSKTQIAAGLVVAGVLLLLAWIVPTIAGFSYELRDSQPPAERGVVVRVLSDTRQDSARGEIRTRELEVAVGERVVRVTDQQIAGGFSLVPPKPGDEVLLQPAGADSFYIADHVRQPLLFLIALVFAALVIVVGGWHGVRSLLALAASFVVLVRFVLPGILSGYDPLVISVVGGTGIMALALVIAHGANRKSAAAVTGTALALGLIVVLSEIAIVAGRFTGLADDDAATVNALFGDIDARGLLLSGILIGALGVLDDVTMSQASTVLELSRANPALMVGDLFARAMRVGRDHIASIVNTLVLAYAGAALPLLIILASQPESIGTLINRELVATEIVRTLVGSIGIVAAVPASTLVAAFMVVRRPGQGVRPEEPPDVDLLAAARDRAAAGR